MYLEVPILQSPDRQTERTEILYMGRQYRRQTATDRRSRGAMRTRGGKPRFSQNLGGAAGRVRHCHSGTKAARQGKAAYPTNVVTGKRFRSTLLDESGWDATNSRSRLTISRTVKKFRARLSQVKQAPSETSKSGRIWSECKWSSDKRGGNGRRFLEEVSL